MHRKHIYLTLLAAMLPAAATAADIAQSILEKVRTRQIDRWEGVNCYLVEQSLAGNRVNTYFQRVETKTPDGKPFTMFQNVPRCATSADLATGAVDSSSSGSGSNRPLTPEELELFAQGMEMTGDATAKGIEDGLEDAGLPRGLLAASGSDPTATFDPRVMMGANAQFARGAAQAQGISSAERARDQQESAEQAADFMEEARLVGMEEVDGQDAFHLRAEGLNHTQKSDGDEFTLQSVSLWIDSTEYVPLRTKIDGIARSGGESRPITIERFDQDYRDVAGSRMYEPHRQVMRLAGVMNPEQQQEMRDAQAKMADFEKQLAEMPEGQRQMVMKQMGPQLDMMRSMASGGGFEFVTEIHRITVNPDNATAQPAALPSAVPAPGSAMPATAAVTAPAAAIAAPHSDPMPPTAPADALRQSQESCLKEKMAKAQAAQKKKRGFGSLLNAASRAAGMFGNQDVARAAGDVYAAGATADDLASAARDLGITEDEIAACQNPG